MMMITTSLDNGLSPPTKEKLSCEEFVSQTTKEYNWILTYGTPKLKPIPPNAETSSNNNLNMSNHFLFSSSRFGRSIIAIAKTAHTSHHISVRYMSLVSQ